MDHAQDVERLFSWLKAPMVHYREFAPQLEVAEAVATWPIVHKAAVQTGIAGEEKPGPSGDSGVRERLARERMAMPPAAARAIHDAPLFAEPPAPTPGGLADQPSGAASGHPAPPAPAEIEPPAEPVASAAAEPRRETPASRVAAGEPARPERAAPRMPHPANERGALFRSRGGERETPPVRRSADRQDRSLDAVFSRLSGGRDRLSDPRERGRTNPGLGALFGRLR